MIDYPDLATFYSVAPEGYGANKQVVEAEEVPVIFVQSTGYIKTGNAENIDADAVIYPDPENAFITENHFRIEGMYIKCSPFGGDAVDSWYKVTRVSVFKDHLLNNEVDNVELQLKKSAALPGVS